MADCWACDTFMWCWSADTLFWQLPIDHNMDVQYQVAGQLAIETVMFLVSPWCRQMGGQADVWLQSVVHDYQNFLDG